MNDIRGENVATWKQMYIKRWALPEGVPSATFSAWADLYRNRHLLEEMTKFKRTSFKLFGMFEFFFDKHRLER
jgi:hypothetical protein